MCDRLGKKILQFRITGSKATKKEEKSRGSITLEATIFLMIFILFYMALMDLVQLARAQVILQYSLNETAREVSEWSYILSKTGVVKKRMTTSKKANEFIGKAEELINSTEQLGSYMASGDVAGTIGALDDVSGQVDDFISNIDELPNNLAGIIKTMGADIASDFVIGQLTESIVKEQIQNMTNKSPDIYLKDLGIKGGFSGLDFSESKWANEGAGGLPVLEVAVVYEIDFNLGLFRLGPREYKLVAKTALW